MFPWLTQFLNEREALLKLLEFSAIDEKWTIMRLRRNFRQISMELPRCLLFIVQNLRHFHWSMKLAGKTEETEIIRMTPSLVVLSLYQQLSSVDYIVRYQKLWCYGNVNLVVFVFIQKNAFLQNWKIYAEPLLKRVERIGPDVLH